jgi:hypothetical protein
MQVCTEGLIFETERLTHCQVYRQHDHSCLTHIVASIFIKLTIFQIQGLILRFRWLICQRNHHDHLGLPHNYIKLFTLNKLYLYCRLDWKSKCHYAIPPFSQKTITNRIKNKYSLGLRYYFFISSFSHFSKVINWKSKCSGLTFKTPSIRGNLSMLEMSRKSRYN